MAEDTKELPVPEPFPQPLEDIKVFNQDETKLYRARALLAILDSDVYEIDRGGIQTRGPLPVEAEDGRRIGFASVFFDGDKMFADISIDYASPERLLAETQSIKLYARPWGAMAVVNSPLFDFHAKLIVRQLFINGIVLSTQAPSDGRIAPFGAAVI